MYIIIYTIIINIYIYYNSEYFSHQKCLMTCVTHTTCVTHFYLQIISKHFLTKSSHENAFLYAEKFVPLQCR